jgi:acetyl-CoA synthetase
VLKKVTANQITTASGGCRPNSGYGIEVALADTRREQGKARVGQAMNSRFDSAQGYDEMVASAAPFAWHIPSRFNIGFDCCDKWADGSEKLALIHEEPDGTVHQFSFDDLKAWSNRLANVWREQGIGKGDRIGICLSQSPVLAIAHLAAYKLGAIAVPLFTLFGPDALQYRLANSGAVAVITDETGIAKIDEGRSSLTRLKILQCTHGCGGGWQSVWNTMSDASASFDVVDTSSDEPALIIYTSGTTGGPKGVLHAHRVLLGHLPGVETSHDGLPQPGDRIWTPADWAWIGGLLDVLMPALHHGVPVVSRRFQKFDPEEAFALIERHSVRNLFLPPTALKLMRKVAKPRERWSISVRTVASGGESLGEELLDWGREAFGITINEFYGQTECNVVVSSCGSRFKPRPGAIGKAVPGHDVRIVDEDGDEVPVGTVGNIAIRSPDPVMFLGYWQNAAATKDKLRGSFLITGDLGFQEEEGFIRFLGRNDDVITTAGYRVGPGPIEDCILGHPAVQLAAVVGVPDPERTEIVKAFVVLKEGFEPDEQLTESIQSLVRTRLGAHEYPRAVCYVDALPMTATGKIVRRELRARR